MAVAAFRKIWDYLVGENDEEAEDEADIVDTSYGYGENEEEETEETNTSKFSVFKGRGSKASANSQSQAVTMKILKPTNYDDVDEIIRQLKVKNGIVMNLEYVNKDIARRIIDTVSGATSALDGHIEKVSNAIFVVAPCNYDVVNEPISKEKGEKSIPWAK